MTRRPLRLSDIIEARAAEAAADMAVLREKDRVAGILSANPQIGVLCREGMAVYYVNFPYTEATDPAALVAA